MRKSIIAALVALALIQFTGAAAAQATFEGSILVGNPATGFYNGVTELVTPCDPESALNGVDGHWFDVRGLGTTFTLEMDETLDADVYFYTADCTYLGGASSGLLGVTESGTIPPGTAFAIVDGFAGTGAFTLTISG